jgi:hypothetical protein
MPSTQKQEPSTQHPEKVLLKAYFPKKFYRSFPILKDNIFFLMQKKTAHQ